MLIDIAQSVGGYLHDVFIGNADWGILIGYVEIGRASCRERV